MVKIEIPLHSLLGDFKPYQNAGKEMPAYNRQNLIKNGLKTRAMPVSPHKLLE
jgi:hypothetical protein